MITSGVSSEMLAHFPARDVEEAASKEFIGAAIADLRTEVKSDIGELRTDMADLRTEVKGDISRLEVALERGLRVQAAATVGAVAATLGIVSVANGLF